MLDPDVFCGAAGIANLIVWIKVFAKYR